MATARASPSAKAQATEIRVGRRRVRISNPQKVLYPSAGFTKSDVVAYYTEVAPALLPHLHDRPLTLKRYPSGVEAPFFYEKRCPSHRPDWVQTVSVYVEGRQQEISFCVANDAATLAWLANLADLELHTALACAPHLDRPTALVFDLDPGRGASLRECANVALALRTALDEDDLKAWPKTSGSKGMQLYVPLNYKVGFDETKAYARALGDRLSAESPKQITTKMAKSARNGRVFIDWSQNAPSKTTVCVYSLRGTSVPGVSTPLTWDEVEEASQTPEPALRFSPKDVLKRVQTHGDLFAPVLHVQQSLPASRRKRSRA